MTAVAIGIGVALAAPSLPSGLCADDWMQSLVARGLHPFAGLPADRFDLFSFAGHDPTATPVLMDSGLFPWWTDPQAKLAFWRPLTALTHLADWTLWPGSPILMHAQSLVWFALALLAVAAFYRRFIGGWAAGLATLFYAVDDAHGLAVSWIANRNAMIAVACGLPALLAQDRWRREGWRPGAWLAPLFFAAALCAGESSIAVAGYLFAYALCLDRGSLLVRLRALLPCLAVGVAWRLAYRLLGYGTTGSGVYIDPASDPLAFLRVLPGRAAYLLAAQFALPWSDFANLWPLVSPHAARVALAVAVITVALLVALFAPLCRRDPLARFLALGAVLAVVPISSAFPADRLLFFTGIGAIGLLATWLERAPRGAGYRVAATLLVLVHGVLAPPLLAFRTARALGFVVRPIERADRSLPSTAALAGRTMVLVNPVSDFIPSYLWLLRGTAGESLPRLRWLATGTSPVSLTREDSRTLRIRPQDGFVAQQTEQILRDPAHRGFVRGEVVRLGGLEIQVTEVLPDGRPAEARAIFDRPLEDPSLYWAAWDRTDFKPFTPPRVGESILLPGVNLLAATFPHLAAVLQP